MRDFNLPSLPTQLVGVDDAAVLDMREHTHLYGFFDPAGAPSTGYNMLRVPPANDKQTISADALAVEFGKDAAGSPMTTFDGRPVPAGGCKAKGVEAIGGALPRIDVAALPDNGPQEPAADPRVIEANAKWSACMKAKGYHYATPYEATTSPVTKADRAGATVVHSPEEIAQATADVDCKLSTNLVGIDLAVQISYDKTFIASHTAGLGEYRRQIADRVQAATRIVTAG